MRNKSLFKTLRGYVTFSAIGGFPERFLSDIFSSGIKVWAVKQESAIITACTYRENYLQVSRIARKYGLKLSVLKRKGPIFKALRYKNRFGIYLGLITFSLFLLLMSNYIWRIDIVGNETLSSVEITEVLENLGVYKGAFSPVLDLRQIENQALLQLKQLSWIGINQHGSKITVDVKERVFAPYIVPLYRPCNIIAGRAGQLVFAEVYSGKQVVALKSGVAEGDIIVSGTIEDEAGGVMYVHSDAVIIAQYEEEKKFSMPLEQTEKILTGNSINRDYIDIFGLDLPLFISLPMDENYFRTQQEKKLNLFGIELPITIKKNTYSQYAEKTITLEPETVRQQLLDQAMVYEETIMPKIEIISKEDSVRLENDILTVTVNYTLRGDIAVKSEILTNYKNTAFNNN